MAKNAPSTRVVGADEVDPLLLDAFLDEAFSPAMREFLAQHSDWWHRGPGHRWAALHDGVVAGYRAYTPATILLDGKELPAAWGFDLFVLPRFRGLGLQRLLDGFLAEASDLVLSFPSDVGAKVYSKQGSGIRDDLRLFQLSLAPRPLTQAAPTTAGRARYLARRARELGVRGAARQALLRARAVGHRAQSAGYRPQGTERVQEPDVRALEDIFLRFVPPGVATSLRNTDFFRWRYLDAPYRSELAFYLRGLDGAPTHYAVVRFVPAAREARILDLFGDLTDAEGLADVLRTILHDSVGRGTDRVFAVGSSPEIVRALRSAGFALVEVRPFRWRAVDARVQERLASAPLFWTLGDSCLDRRG